MREGQRDGGQRSEGHHDVKQASLSGPGKAAGQEEQQPRLSRSEEEEEEVMELAMAVQEGRVNEAIRMFWRSMGVDEETEEELGKRRYLYNFAIIQTAWLWGGAARVQYLVKQLRSGPAAGVVAMISSGVGKEEEGVFRHMLARTRRADAT